MNGRIDCTGNTVIICAAFASSKVYLMYTGKKGYFDFLTFYRNSIRFIKSLHGRVLLVFLFHMFQLILELFDFLFERLLSGLDAFVILELLLCGLQLIFQ